MQLLSWIPLPTDGLLLAGQRPAMRSYLLMTNSIISLTNKTITQGIDTMRTVNFRHSMPGAHALRAILETGVLHKQEISTDFQQRLLCWVFGMTVSGIAYSCMPC